MMWEFSPPDPKAKMKMVSKIERVQPTAAGVDEKGELVWEGREMPRWQQEFFRKTYSISREEFGHLWDQVAHHQSEDEEFLPENGKTPYWAIATKEEIRKTKIWADLVHELKKGKKLI